MKSKTKETYIIPADVSHTIGRMVKRNEKRPLAQALVTLKQDAGDSIVASNAWYLAACHANGAGVARILVEAGVRMTSDKPLIQAASRDQWDVVCVMAGGCDRLSHLVEIQGLSDPHILCRAANCGNIEALEALFEIPVYKDYQKEKHVDLNIKEKATLVLSCLAGEAVLENCELTVNWLKAKGANLNFHSDYHIESGKNGTLLFRAIRYGQVDLAYALAKAGANLSHGNKGGLAQAFSQCLFENVPSNRSDSELNEKIWGLAQFFVDYHIGLPKIEVDAGSGRGIVYDYRYNEMNKSHRFVSEDALKLIAMEENRVLMKNTARVDTGNVKKRGMRL